MNALFDQLFSAWCGPYDPERAPECLRGDPLRAYGLYAFEEGFKLAMELAFASLDPKDLCEID